MRKRQKVLSSTRVQIGPDEPVYVISVVSRIVHIPVWTLRVLEEKGVIKPKRLGKKLRLYSMREIELLEFIHRLMDEERVNISGIRLILEMKGML